MFAGPVVALVKLPEGDVQHMVRMGVLGEARGLGLLGSEEALLLLSNLEEPPQWKDSDQLDSTTHCKYNSI